MNEMPAKKSTNVPNELKSRFDEIAQYISDFCDAKLNDEYKQTCLQLCAGICRKKPSPIISGKAIVWACGIVHTIGMVNFLFDSSGKPYMKSSELYEWFGVSENTGGGKSRQIRNTMKIASLDRKWTLPSQLEHNPMIWMIEFNGFVVDVRYCEKWVQEEAFKKGLIPYIPERE
jgi:hypothetical protein